MSPVSNEHSKSRDKSYLEFAVLKDILAGQILSLHDIAGKLCLLVANSHGFLALMLIDL